MDGAAVAISAVLLASAVLFGSAAAWVYWKTSRPARLLRDALLALADEEADRSAAALPAARRLARAATPLADCAEPLQMLADRLREMDRQLHDEAVNLQTILGGLSEGVLVVDRAHKVRLVNDGLRRMFDLRGASPLNRSLLEVVRHHDVQGAVLEALDGGPARTRSLTLSVRQEDGRYAEKHFDLTAAGLLPRGAERPAGAIVIFHDVTRLRALESVRRDFVANVSHELRTPLAIVNGYLETLLENGAEALGERATTERFLRVMAKHGQRLNLLVEDLLTLSELESGGSGQPIAAGEAARVTSSSLRFETLDVRTCLERVVERLAPVATDRGVTVTLDVSPPALRVEADAHRLDQALFNLLDNALKYGASGTVTTAAAAATPTVAVRVGHCADDPDSVEFAVSDGGPGIPPADQAHVFERFYRVHKDRSREAGGTGLGLSIVKHIAQAHGGSVALESQPGRGATFRLRLPTTRNPSESSGSDPLSLSGTTADAA